MFEDQVDEQTHLLAAPAKIPVATKTSTSESEQPGQDQRAELQFSSSQRLSHWASVSVSFFASVSKSAKRWLLQAKSYTKVTIPVAFLLIITLAVCVLIHSSDWAISDSLEWEFGEVELRGISEDGVLLNIKGSATCNYDKLNFLMRNTYMLIGSVIGSISLIQVEDSTLFVQFPQLNGSQTASFHSMGKLQLPPLQMDISHRHFNEFNFDVSMGLDGLELVKLHQEYLVIMDQPVKNIKINAKVKPKFEIRKAISLGQQSRELTYNLKIPNDGSNVQYKIEKFKLHTLPKSIKMGSQIILKPISENLPAKINLDLPPLEWDMYIPGCKLNLLYLGTIFTHDLKVLDGNETSIIVKANIPQLSSNLQKNCVSNGFTPINRWVKEAETGAKVFIKARSDSSKNTKLPSWLFSFVSNTFQPIDVISGEFFTKKLFQLDHYEISNSTATIANNAESLPICDSDINLKLSLPFPNQNNSLVEVRHIIGDLCLLYKDQIFSKIYMSNWQSVETNNDQFSIHIKNSKLDIIDPRITSDLVQGFLTGYDMSITVKSLLDYDIKTPVSKSIFQQIEQDFKLLIKGSDGKLFEKLNTKLSNLRYINTSSDRSLRFLIQVELTNPLDNDLNLEFLNLRLVYHDHIVGNIDLKNIELRKASSYQFESILRLQPPDHESKTELEKLLSKYISSKEPSLEIRGHEKSSKIENLAKALSGLAIPIKIPSFYGDDGDSSGFILGFRFYLLSSTVEIDVYNPISNKEATIIINQAQAVYQKTVVAFTDDSSEILLPPGKSTTRRISVSFPKGIAKDILRKAVNGNLTVETQANFKVQIDDYSLNLDYEGSGQNAEIKL